MQVEADDDGDIGTDDGALWRTKDAGKTWDDLFVVEVKKAKAPPADDAAAKFWKRATPPATRKAEGFRRPCAKPF